MRIGIVSIFPAMFDAITAYGVTGRAVEKGLLDLQFWNPRDYTDPDDNYHSVDDRPYGGGPGMVMMVEPLRTALVQARAGVLASSEVGDAPVKPKCIYLSPQGKKLDQQGVEQIAAYQNIVLLAGRYEGVDERLIETEIDEEWSIGDYVISGGELAAMVLIDAIARLVPGVLGHEGSAQEDSFFNGLLDYPHYTRPEAFKKPDSDGLGNLQDALGGLDRLDRLKIPEVLLSGHHEKIRLWRLKQSLGRTWERRPDMLKGRSFTKEEQALLAEYIREQNI